MSDELKGITEAIETNGKTLVIAAAGIACFLAAPKTDENLHQALDELKVAAESWANTENANTVTGCAANLDNTRSRIVQALAKPQAPNGSPQAFRPSGDDAKRELSEEERAILGYAQRSTLADLVELFGEHGHRCDVDTASAARTIEELSRLFSKAPVKVARVDLRVAHSPPAVAAVGGYVAALPEVARLEDQATAEARAASTPAPLGPRPEKIWVWQGSTRIEVDPPSALLWDRALAAQSEKKADAKIAEARQRVDREALEERLADLTSKERLLEDQITMQPSQGSTGPSYVVATVVTDQPSALGASHLLLPMICKDAPIVTTTIAQQAKGAKPASACAARLPMGPLLPHLRISEQWERLKDLRPDQAEPLLDEAVANGEEKLDVFGLKVPERLLYRTAPLLFVAGLVWHVLYLFRFRHLTKSPELAGVCRAAIDTSPGLPARRNPVIAVLITIAVTAIGSALYCAGGESWKGWPFAAILLLSAAALWLSMTIDPRPSPVSADDSASKNVTKSGTST